MNESALHLDLLIIAIGLIVVLALSVKALFERLRMPALMGYLLVGMLVGAADKRWGFMPETAHAVFELFSSIGVIALLFRVGLKSDIRKLMSHLEGASLVWVSNILFSGLAGFGVAFLLGVDTLSSIIIGVAMTATSVGVSAAVWERNDAIQTDDGQRFIAIAELDDISGIVLLAILFALLPALGEAFGTAGASGASDAAASTAVGWMLTRITALVLGKLLLFGAACYLFARYVEKPLMQFFSKSESGTDTVISVISIGIIIAGMAGLLGFSVALGAFFAGLAFSRNRDAIENQTPYTAIYDLFVPFFFFSIGLSVDVSVFGQVWLLAAALLAAAVLGKIIGAMLPSLALVQKGSAFTLGISMVPHAEITMIIMNRSRQMGEWAVDSRIFSAMFAVVFCTCLLTPPLLRLMINRYSR